MKYRAISVKEANRINRQNGMETWEDDEQKTFWATDENESGTWMFYSLRERKEFLERKNRR